MANIRKHVAKNGKITFYIRVSDGYDSKGEQIVRSTTWTPPANLTERQAEKELQKQVIKFEDEVKNGSCYDSNTRFEDYANEWLSNNKPMNPDSITDWTSKFVQRNNLPHFTPHSLRHTHATLLIAEGVSVSAVSRRLGHSSIATTSRIYVHAIQSADEIASDVIDSKLNTSLKKSEKEKAE